MKEILESKVLQRFGFAFAVLHVLALIFWEHQGTLLRRLPKIEDPICWPFLPFCRVFKPESQFQINVLACLLIFSIVSIVISYFVSMRLFWWCNLFGFLVKQYIILLDYRFMGNYHFMPQLILFTWLFLPNKEKLIPYLTVGFYVAAGLLKFNPEWLSGATLSKDFVR